MAAVATASQLTVVTRNLRHLEDSAVKTLNPWLVSA